MKSFFRVVACFLCILPSASADGIDFAKLDQALQGAGLRGWIHASNPTAHLYVFTYRDPKDFFTHYEFPLVPKAPLILELLKKTGRHDEVVLKGKILDEMPQKHIEVADVAMVKAYSDGLNYKPFELDPKVLDTVANGKSMIARVHAVGNGGKVVVLDFQDLIVPVVFKDTAFTQDLFRGDKVRLFYRVRKHPDAPLHVSPDPEVAKPIEMIEPIRPIHGQKITREGILVLFPKSPQINLDVYALQDRDSNGVKTEYTLVNFDDDAVFQKIRDKLKRAWDARASSAERGRGKLLNRSIRIRATGVGNVVDPNQANPQILLEGPNAVEVLP